MANSSYKAGVELGKQQHQGQLPAHRSERLGSCSSAVGRGQRRQARPPLALLHLLHQVGGVPERAGGLGGAGQSTGELQYLLVGEIQASEAMLRLPCCCVAHCTISDPSNNIDLVYSLDRKAAAVGHGLQARGVPQLCCQLLGSCPHPPHVCGLLQGGEVMGCGVRVRRGGAKRQGCTAARAPACCSQQANCLSRCRCSSNRIAAPATTQAKAAARQQHAPVWWCAGRRTLRDWPCTAFCMACGGGG